MLRTLPIRTYLVISGALALISLVVTAGVGIFGMLESNIGLSEQATATAAMRDGMLADMMHDNIRADVTLGVLVAEDPTAGNIDEVSTGLEESLATLKRALSELQALPLPPDLAAASASALSVADAYAEAARGAVSSARGGADTAKAALPGFEVAFHALESELDQLANQIEAFSTDTGTHASGQNHTLMGILIGTLAVSVLLVALANWKTMHAITRPINRLRAALREVATGDFSVRIGTITRNDDIGAIARDIDIVTARVLEAMATQDRLREAAQVVIARLGAGLRGLSAGDLNQRIDEPLGDDYEALRADYNETVARLGDLITQVVDASSGIHRLSGDMNIASENLSTRTVSQAATLEETAAALEELTASVREAAETARHVETTMTETRIEVEESGRIVKSAVEAMGEIEASAGHISQIIGVIDDIAFQTNLLALNAGVEAARAGEAGKGFAVVASEVRALAQRSSHAAREIKGLIDNSANHIHRGVNQVNLTGTALATVVDRVGRMAKLVSTIASAAGEQARGLSEINIGVAQLDQVTQQNAAMSEQAGITTQMLNRQADGLANLVALFQVSATADAQRREAA